MWWYIKKRCFYYFKTCHTICLKVEIMAFSHFELYDVLYNRRHIHLCLWCINKIKLNKTIGSSKDERAAVAFSISAMTGFIFNKRDSKVHSEMFMWCPWLALYVLRRHKTFSLKRFIFFKELSTRSRMFGFTDVIEMDH